jgi:hypothetical protein
VSSDTGDTEELARLLSNLLNERTLHGEDVHAHPNTTFETVNGHATLISYDGRDYTVIVTLSSSQLAADEFWRYDR